MIFRDSEGRFFSKEEVASLSPQEIEVRGIHEYEKNQEKLLFDHMDEMITK